MDKELAKKDYEKKDYEKLQRLHDKIKSLTADDGQNDKDDSKQAQPPAGSEACDGGKIDIDGCSIDTPGEVCSLSVIVYICFRY